MKAKKNTNFDFMVTEGTERYIETKQAQSTSRLLDGSTDHGFWMEYVGYGTIDGVPVRAIYLLDHDQMDIEDEGDFDWDLALKNGRIEVEVDDLDEKEYETLQDGGELIR